jgi:hypothetical protein
VERIARYLLRDGETLPLVKPLAAPLEESGAASLAVMALMYLESGECPPEDVAAIEAIVAAHDGPAA